MGQKTTKPIEHLYVAVEDRLRSMRSLSPIRTGQCLLEGIELVQTVRRGNVRYPTKVIQARCMHPYG